MGEAGETQTPTPEAPNITACANECLMSFQQCLHAAAHLHPPELSAVEDQLARFSTWATSIGVFAPGRASMDHRLRYTPDVHSVVTGLLDLLSKRIRHCTSILETAAANQLQQSFTNIATEISHLNKLTNTIRRAGNETQILRANDFPMVDEDGNDVAPTLQATFERYVADRFRGCSEVIQKRIANGMVLRRKRILYKRHRQGNTAIPLQQTVAQAAVIVPPVPTNANQKRTRPREADDAINSIIHSQAVSATTVVPAKFKAAALSPSIISASRTVALANHESLTFPHAPGQAKKQMYEQDKKELVENCRRAIELGESKSVAESALNDSLQSALQKVGEIICPFCLYALPAQEVFDEKKWHRHVQNELDPYICLFEDCPQPDMLYSHSDEWLEHLHEHNKTWSCFSHPELGTFATRDEFIQHMRESHKSTLSDSQLRILANRNCMRRRKLFTICPLCGEPDDEVKRNIEHHITGHLRSLALKSLPAYWESSPATETVENSDTASQPQSRSTVAAADFSDASDFGSSKSHVVMEDLVGEISPGGNSPQSVVSNSTKDVSLDEPEIDYRNANSGHLIELMDNLRRLNQSHRRSGHECPLPDCSGRVYATKNDRRHHMMSVHKLSEDQIQQLVDTLPPTMSVETGPTEEAVRIKVGKTTLKIPAGSTITLGPANTAEQPRQHRDAYEQTLLLRACGRGEYEVVKQRLSERPADVYVPDKAGNTPLHIAAMNGYVDIVKLLIDAGSILAYPNDENETPLFDAVENGHLQTVKLLLDAGLSPAAFNFSGERAMDKITAKTENADSIRSALLEAMPEEQYTIKCICNYSGNDGNTIYCDTCDTWQHLDCYYPNNREEATREDFEHSCVSCNRRPLDREGAIKRFGRPENAAASSATSQKLPNVDNTSFKFKSPPLANPDGQIPLSSSPQSMEPTQIVNYWTPSEYRAFPGMLKSFGSDWDAIAAYMGSKTAVVVKNFFTRRMEHGKREWASYVMEADEKKRRGETLPNPPQYHRDDRMRLHQGRLGLELPGIEWSGVPQLPARLPCEFAVYSGCDASFSLGATDAWIEHVVDVHLDSQLPLETICWFCDTGYFAANTESESDRAIAFRERMQHIAIHFANGMTSEDIRTDFLFINHIHACGLISNEQFMQAKGTAEVRKPLERIRVEREAGRRNRRERR